MHIWSADDPGRGGDPKQLTRRPRRRRSGRGLRLTAAHPDNLPGHHIYAGVLVQVGSGTRNRVWQCPEVIDALDAFATRAARRPTRD